MHLTENIELLRYSVAVVKQHRPFIIDAWVVLPEHLHCIWTLPHNDDDFSSRWRDIKGCFSRTLKRQPLWQPRFWEHAIRDEDDYRRHVDYIHINPLKHGWVTRVIDWPFSTFHRDVQRGLYPQIGLAIALILAAVNADSLSPGGADAYRGYKSAPTVARIRRLRRYPGNLACCDRNFTQL